MKFRKKPVIIDATQWFKNGDHPEDYSIGMIGLKDGEAVFISGKEMKEKNWEGQIVRYYRHPDVRGKKKCSKCGDIMHNHGWVDTLEDGHNVCVGDWIIKGVAGEYYPCKPDIFEKTYEKIEDETKE